MKIVTKCKAFGILFSIALLYTSALYGEITLPKAISSHMVLQRDKPVNIWGFASKGESIIVRFNGQNKQTVTDTAGHWAITLAPMPASATPATMEIIGTNVINLENILIGDVWVCSGQSNMEFPMDRTLKKYPAPKKGTDKSAEELSKPKSETLRIIYVERKLNHPDISSKGWTDCNDSTIRYISAAGYFFAKEINEKEHIPIGLISTSWGGTRIEEWTPAWAYKQSPVFKSLTQETNFKIDGMVPGQKFKYMVEPIIPYTLKGIVWYQGESNLMVHDMASYPDKVKLMMDTWRNLWKQPDMPFYCVQISPYHYTKRTKDKYPHTATHLPEMWEAQTHCLQIPYTGMVVTTDLVDDLNNIHPSYKWEVGHRLALWALAKDYKHTDIEYSGPMYKKMKARRGKIILEFDHVGGGLVSNDNKPLSWFTIAGPDGKFVPAIAEIKDNKIEVSSPDVKKPKAVRFAWDETAQPNFFNKDGLPASPFRTDGSQWLMK